MAEEVEKKDDKKQKSLREIASGVAGWPPQEAIDGWKSKWGDVYVSGLSENEFFVFRAVRRGEWRKLALAREMGAQGAEGGMDQLRFEEVVCETCVLWPEVDKDWWEGQKGGTATTLSEQVLQQSNFMNPAAASMLVEKL